MLIIVFAKFCIRGKVRVEMDETNRLILVTNIDLGENKDDALAKIII